MSIQVDQTELPVQIRGMHDDESPWYEHKGELLFGENTGIIRERVQELAQEDDIGRYSPRNKFTEKTKIRTSDVRKFMRSLEDEFESFDSEFEFFMGDRLLRAVTTYEKGPQRTDVTFSPSFGRSAGIGGKEYYQQKVLLEILRYEVEVFWHEVAEPVFEEYHEKYPY